MKSPSLKICLAFALMLFFTFVFVQTSKALNTQRRASYQYVKLQGRQLMVDFNMDGAYEKYIVKGVDYQPFPIGGYYLYPWGTCQILDENTGAAACEPNTLVPSLYNRSTLLDRDFQNLVFMSANTIRTWTKVTQTLLDKANQYGIKVIAGYPMNPLAIDLTNQTQRNQAKAAFRSYVAQFKNDPAILFWAIGNENNYQLTNIQKTSWYSLINEMAGEAHAEEGVYAHPVAVVNGEITDIGQCGQTVNHQNFGTCDSNLSNLDIWGANVYRGQTFTNLFTDYESKTSKPFWISEYGTDAYFTVDTQNPSFGYEDQALQALWDRSLWDEIMNNNSIVINNPWRGYPGYCIGATIMAYSDEWWKAVSGFPGSLQHDPQGFYKLGNAPDNYFNEEWWGLYSVTNNSSANDILTPRQAVSDLKKRFQCVNTTNNTYYYAGSDNGKSCDGTEACCPTRWHRAKNNQCARACTLTPISVPFPIHWPP